MLFLYSDNIDSNSMLENSLTAKEKIISELNMEIHNVETALANERESHVAEIKKLNYLLNKKVKFVLSFVFYAENLNFVLKISFRSFQCLMLAYRHLVLNQDTIIEEMKKELQERPSAKLVDDLRKKVKILQVFIISSVFWCSLSFTSY